MDCGRDDEVIYNRISHTVLQSEIVNGCKWQRQKTENIRNNSMDGHPTDDSWTHDTSYVIFGNTIQFG